MQIDLAKYGESQHISPMIERHFQKGDAASVAMYSGCENYRYSLTRTWDPKGRKAHFIMLNPSTATEMQNDPTVERCERRARTLGFGAFRVTNIFAWRDTDPKKMRAASDPIGTQNDAAIAQGCAWADQIIAAWGSHGAHMNRGQEVKQMLQNMALPVFHLGLTKEGHPKHPLYIAYTQQPHEWIWS